MTRDLVKVCPRCGWTMPHELFAVDRSKASGRKSWCLHCDRWRARAYWEANKDRVRARQRAAKRRRKYGDQDALDLGDAAKKFTANDSPDTPVPVFPSPRQDARHQDA